MHESSCQLLSNAIEERFVEMCEDPVWRRAILCVWVSDAATLYRFRIENRTGLKIGPKEERTREFMLLDELFDFDFDFVGPIIDWIDNNPNSDFSDLDNIATKLKAIEPKYTDFRTRRYRVWPLHNMYMLFESLYPMIDHMRKQQMSLGSQAMLDFRHLEHLKTEKIRDILPHLKAIIETIREEDEAVDR